MASTHRPQLRENLVKYFAGLLDADGSLSFNFKRDIRYPDKLYVLLRMNLTASDAVDKQGFVAGLAEATGMGSISRYGKNKQFVTWTVSRQADLEMLLPRLTKHMVVKAQHWQFMLETWRAYRGRVITDAERTVLEDTAKQSRRTRCGPLSPKNHPTWAWLAGYIDGDGYYTVQRKPGGWGGCWVMRMGCVAHTNDAHALRFMQTHLGGNIVSHGQSGCVWQWYRSLQLGHRSFVLRALPNLAKHSRLKRYKIDQIIHIHQQRLSVQSPDGVSDSLAAL